jgi:hypothetical protein
MLALVYELEGYNILISCLTFEEFGCPDRASKLPQSKLISQVIRDIPLIEAFKNRDDAKRSSIASLSRLSSALICTE